FPPKFGLGARTNVADADLGASPGRAERRFGATNRPAGRRKAGESMGFQRVSGGAAAGSRMIGIGVLAALVLVAAPPLGLAASTHVVQPHDWQLGFQEAATPVKDRIEGLHDILLVIITCISLFVMGLLVYVMVRFNARANPVPSRTSHNT